MNRHVSLEKFEKWSFRKLIMFSEEKKNPTEISNLDYRNVLGWLSGTNRWLVGYIKMENIEKFNVFIFVENYGKEAGQKIQIQVQRWTKVSSFPQISVQSSWNIFICGKWGKRILTGEIHIPLNSEPDKSWIISAILLLKISQTGHIANIVNAVQCQSYLSGHNACHEFRCSISRIVNNKGHIKTRWRMLLHISPCKNLTRFLWMRKGDELNVPQIQTCMRQLILS